MDLSDDKKFIIWTIVAVAIAAGFGVFWYLNREEFPISPGKRAEQEELTKREILERLSAPTDASQRTSEERKAILERLSAPGESRYTEAEKKRILDSLRAPIAE